MKSMSILDAPINKLSSESMDESTMASISTSQSISLAAKPDETHFPGVDSLLSNLDSYTAASVDSDSN